MPKCDRCQSELDPNYVMNRVKENKEGTTRTALSFTVRSKNWKTTHRWDLMCRPCQTFVDDLFDVQMGMQDEVRSIREKIEE